ncbi:MAG: NYN domain-containing protein [Patescibacteria group bacterium]|nr:NYN domain-containing protein [Patescibacteria group bacterium]
MKIRVFIDYENLMGAIISILKKMKPSPKFKYEQLKKFFKWLAKGKNTEIFCYYEDKKPKEEERKTRLVDYFPILKQQLEQERISFNFSGASRVSVDSRIFAAFARMITEDVAQIYLVSGDGDYAETLQVLREQKKKIVVVSGKDCLSGLLIAVADEIYYIDDEINNIMSS